MRASWLARPRTILVPTLAGWAALAVVLAAAGALLARALPGFLAVDAPAGRGVLVVEGWIPRSALRRAAEEARRGTYRAVLVSGGPILDAPAASSDAFVTHAERAAAFLRSLDVGGLEIVAVPAAETRRDRTYESARAVRRWLEARGWRADAVDVYTAGPHARRSRALYRRALGDGAVIGVRSAPPPEYDLARWWRSSAGAKDVLGEAIGWAWMECCFWPGDGG